MNSKQIIRIEHSDGWGIFRAKRNRITVYNRSKNKLLNNLAQRHNAYGKGFPRPSQEGLNMNEKWFCAFKSINQLKYWIRKAELAELIKKKFKIFLLEVTEYQEGKKQVIFTKESIILKQDITKMFKQNNKVSNFIKNN